MNFTAENWTIVLGILGILTTPIAWIFGGKQAKSVEIKKANGDAVSTMQSVYDQFLSDYKDRMNELMNELVTVKNSNIDLQRQFNEIQLQYAKESEKSQNWEKLHRELIQKYTLLEKEYEILKGDHDRLKVDFDKYKKINK